MARSLFLPVAALVSLAACQKPAFAGRTPVSTPLIRPTDLNPVPVDATPSDAGGILPESFVSFSIELAFFPDFAGNLSSPNEFSNTLLENIKDFSGTKPYIRVGGNTQDYAIFDASLEVATKGTYIPEISEDYPLILSIGPSFFESYSTWPDTKFIHGFNLGKNSTAARKSLIASVPLACEALSDGKLLYWELGNEPDLYKTSAQGKVRPLNWTENDYVSEWNSLVGQIGVAMLKANPEFVSPSLFNWIAPSFAGVNNSLKAVPTWQDGLDAGEFIALFSSHNYIGGATQPGVTLQGTLMNHTSTTTSIQKHTREAAALAAAGMHLPYILGEANSLYNQGAPGLSDTFGAALWGVDFNLYAAATGIQRVHMHMGTDYRYAAWQPISTSKAPVGTKPPYYGNIAVAAALGDLRNASVRVRHLALADRETAAAYAVYDAERLARLMVVSLAAWNYSGAAGRERPVVSYNFSLPTTCAGWGVVQRLMANGSDAVAGVTFNGRSYDYERDGGRPVLVGGGMTKDEIVWVGEDGVVSVEVPSSSAALVQLKC